MQLTLEDALRQLRKWQNDKTSLLVKGRKDTGEQLKEQWVKCTEVSESSVSLSGNYTMQLSLESAEFIFEDCSEFHEPARKKYANFESILGIKSGHILISLLSSITGEPVPMLDPTIVYPEA
jgi:hypothetical protein